MSDIDAKPVCSIQIHADFAGGGNPLPIMKIALDRCLSGRNAMLVNKAYILEIIFVSFLNGIAKPFAKIKRIVLA